MHRVLGDRAQEPADCGLRPDLSFSWRVLGRRDELDHVADESPLVYRHLERGLEPAEREPHRPGTKAGTGLAPAGGRT